MKNNYVAESNEKWPVFDRYANIGATISHWIWIEVLKISSMSFFFSIDAKSICWLIARGRQSWQMMALFSFKNHPVFAFKMDDYTENGN